MRTVHRAAIRIATLCAAIGATCIVALLCGANWQAPILVAANVAVAIAVGAIFASVLALVHSTRQWPGTNWASANARAHEGADSSRWRRAVLEHRLDVDEPRLCSQYAMRCTCWSFCGGTANERLAARATVPGEQQPDSRSSPRSQAHSLPIVRRSGMHNCPFRFKSPRGPA